YLLATDVVSLVVFGALLFATVLVATAVALLLIRSLADGFALPLRQVSDALANAARGDFESVANFGDASELRDLAGAVNAMRTSLRTSTISRDYLDRLLSSMGEALLITDMN